MFQRNKHGHIVVMFTGLGLTGVEEIKRLRDSSYFVHPRTKSCFISTEADGYDKNHRLIARRVYHIALIPGKEINDNFRRTTAALRRLGEKYGYGEPMAGHIPRICEAISIEQMKGMGARYISSLHAPIKDIHGHLNLFNVGGYTNDDQGVGSSWGGPHHSWDEAGVFAFPMSPA